MNYILSACYQRWEWGTVLESYSVSYSAHTTLILDLGRLMKLEGVPRTSIKLRKWRKWAATCGTDQAHGVVLLSINLLSWEIFHAMSWIYSTIAELIHSGGLWRHALIASHKCCLLKTHKLLNILMLGTKLGAHTPLTRTLKSNYFIWWDGTVANY